MGIIKAGRGAVSPVAEGSARAPGLAVQGPVEVGIPSRNGLTWLDGEVLGPGDGAGGVVVAVASPRLPESWPTDRPRAVLAGCAFLPHDRTLADRLVRYIFAWQRALAAARHRSTPD